MMAKKKRRSKMKKITFALFLTLLILVLIVPTVFGAGTITQSLRKVESIYVVTMTCTADSADQSYPATVIRGTDTTGIGANVLLGWYLYSIKTISGATAPTDGYSVTVKDDSGFDLLGGKGLTAQSSSKTVPVKVFAFPSGGGFSPISGPLTLAVTGNSVNSANITVTLEFVR
jgi:hypothetical protein